MDFISRIGRNDPWHYPKSIGARKSAKSWELQYTIRLIRELDAAISKIEAESETIMINEIQSPITIIPGIGYRMGAMILAEAVDLSWFDALDKLLAYAGMSPSTYQLRNLKNCYPYMEKRGSRCLRYALYNTANYVCHWDPTFAAYRAKKMAEDNGHLSCSQKTSTPYFRYGEIRTAISLYCINTTTWTW